MKQKVFSFKKGQNVPPWVMHVTHSDSGKNYSGTGTLKFLRSGKLFVTNNGDIVSYPPRARERNGTLMVGCEDFNDVDIKCAGDNKNLFYFRLTCRQAMKELGLKNTVKTVAIPHLDPR